MNEIVDRLYIGDMTDAAKAPKDMQVLCVMWAGESGIPKRCHHIQTTDYHTFSEYSEKIVVADGIVTDTVKMDMAADWIQNQLIDGKTVLVHCAYGIERSPLTVVWYFMRHHDMNLKQAYDLVLEKRPQAQYRGTWLPAEVRLSGVLPERVQVQP
jgi:hypothetical protein